MTEIIANERLAPQVYRMIVTGPEIARKRKAGQFIILRPLPHSERIPLTIADASSDCGTITLVYQVVGKTTHELSLLKTGERLQDLVGPLGQPTHIEKFGTVVCVGGGIGVAPIHPIAQALKAHGNRVISILGARTRELLIMEEEMRRASDEVIVTTDDGSYGTKGFVTDAIKQLADSGTAIDLVVAIGPPIMMKFVAKTTLPYKIKTLVSLNTVMVDGTGMCGGCRVTVGGESKFVCVDGPEFDGHQVDFDEMMKRLRTYDDQEKSSYELFKKTHECRLTGAGGR
ncbi:MAG: ferredoxin-NADP reductase [Planctomycetes bacterium RBG_16_59_8]|nr:MAG: ferredoxin-NADP reductase [Planctomycetes bacterium RBG_16_59_8]